MPAADLKDTFVRIPVHTDLMEAITRVLHAPEFAEGYRIEASLLNGGDELPAIQVGCPSCCCELGRSPCPLRVSLHPWRAWAWMYTAVLVRRCGPRPACRDLAGPAAIAHTPFPRLPSPCPSSLPLSSNRS